MQISPCSLLLTVACFSCGGHVFAEGSGPIREAPSAASTAPHGGTIQFLGLEPHGPLAVSERGHLASPDSTACRTWGRLGSEWQALDRFGRVVGRAKVEKLNRYDVTDCDELDLERTTGDAGAGLFVRGDYEALRVDDYQPTEAERDSLAHLVSRRDATLPQTRRPAADAPLGKRTLFFRVGSSEPTAVVGGRGLTIFRLRGGNWTTEHEIRAQKSDDIVTADVFKVVAVLDMNGDGAVEVVVHESFIDEYADSTLSFDPATKKWRQIEAGIHGAYAMSYRSMRAFA